ncbi:hypothetical protein ABZT43_30900 [Streptomyces sp. NPDC005349]|uniref:hypothetical protein n=1 Tax=Streptomyces sp. NPDC005349 TaxID=3157037 RepID=UPI00339F379F
MGVLDDVGQVLFAFLTLAGHALQCVVELREVLVVAGADVLGPSWPQLLCRVVGLLQIEIEVGGLPAQLLQLPPCFEGLDDQGLLGSGGTSLQRSPVPSCRLQ